MTTQTIVILDPVTCAHCGITFGLDRDYIECRKNDHATWCCPNGHKQHWPQQTRTEKAEAELERTRDELGRARAVLGSTIADRDRQARRAAAARGQVTKIRNRIQAGVCPECRRHFDDLQSHMEGQHPRADE